MSILKSIEVYIPDEEFDNLVDYFSKPKRRNTEPIPAIMGRDAMSSLTQSSRRTSSYPTARSTASRSKSYHTSCTSGYESPNIDTMSNVTGFRRNLDVAGMPPSDYFSTGASEYDRRPEYVGQPPRRGRQDSFLSSPPPQSRQRDETSYTSGQELVRYQGAEQQYTEEPDENDDDSNTICPSDSISCVSSRRSVRPPTARPPYGPPSSSSKGRQPPATCRRSYTYADGVSPTMYSGRSGYSVRSGYQTVERVPKGYSY